MLAVLIIISFYNFGNAVSVSVCLVSGKCDVRSGLSYSDSLCSYAILPTRDVNFRETHIKSLGYHSVGVRNGFNACSSNFAIDSFCNKNESGAFRQKVICPTNIYLLYRPKNIP